MAVAPADPIAAVTHPDPYPYYAELVARRPLFREAGLGLWVASSAAAVTAVLTNERCRVRPGGEPVPAAIVGSPAGEIFGRLVRMNDGARHVPLKAGVSAVLDALAPSALATRSRQWARTLADELTPSTSASGLDAFTFRLAPSVIASLLGASTAMVPEVVRSTAAFVHGIAPGATADAVTTGARAARHLLETGRALASADGLVAALADRAHGEAPEAAVANALGFLSQSYDATAGLIGNTLLAMARHPEPTAPGAMERVVAEVARHDAPVQNTRRFLAGDTVIDGQTLRAGDTVLAVLAAANRDPAANPAPARFDPDRLAARTFTFGVGPHACPGARLAVGIAAAGVEELLARGLAPGDLVERVRYRPSVNARIPLFDAAG